MESAVPEILQLILVLVSIIGVSAELLRRFVVKPIRLIVERVSVVPQMQNDIQTLKVHGDELCKNLSQLHEQVVINGDDKQLPPEIRYLGLTLRSLVIYSLTQQQRQHESLNLHIDNPNAHKP